MSNLIIETRTTVNDTPATSVNSTASYVNGQVVNQQLVLSGATTYASPVGFTAFNMTVSAPVQLVCARGTNPDYINQTVNQMVVIDDTVDTFTIVNTGTVVVTLNITYTVKTGNTPPQTSLVTSINGRAGAVSLLAGAGISIDSSVAPITISALPPTGNSIGAVKAGTGVAIAQDGTLNLVNIVPQLTTYASLRAYTGSAASVVLSDPVVGGTFLYNAADTTSVDNGGTIIVDNLGRRWYRQFDGDVYATWFGADPTGTVDSGSAIAAATNSCVGKRIKFVHGTYICANPIPLTVTNYSWVGERNERGTNAFGANASYSAVQIIFTNTNPTQFLVSLYSTTPPLTSNIGPFEHENLTFNFGQASGFQFGNEAIDPNVGNGTVERYVFGVTFRQCALIAQAANRTSSSTGVITRTGQRMVALCKAFETVFENVSMYGSDTQVRCYGCDKPTLRGVRSQGSHLPLDFQSSGSFTVQHTVQGLQVEGWTFTPIRSAGVGIAVSDTRLEQNDGTPTGSGNVNMTATWGYTANVTAGSATLVFSADMTNILFPNLSIIQITDGTNTDTALVTNVSTTNVTIDTSNLAITWSNATATVYRLHGYGPIHSGNFDGSYSNVSPDASTNTPAFVYRISRGAMSISGGMAESGLHTGVNSMVIGNILPGTFYMNPQMSFNGCTPYVLPDTGHPFVSVTNWEDGTWVNRGQQFRHAGGNPFAEVAKLRRNWIMSPKQTATGVNNANLIPIKRISGDAGTIQQHWAWYVTSGSIQLIDQSLPSTTPGFLRMYLRIVSTNPTDTITVSAVSSGGGIQLGMVNITNSLTTYELDFLVPSVWGSNPTNPCVQLGGNFPFYVVGVLISEEGESTLVNYRAGALQKLVKGGGKTFAPSTATAFLQLDCTSLGGGNTVGGKVKIYATAENPNNGYAYDYTEYALSISDYNNSLRLLGTPTSITSTQGSVNAGVLSIASVVTAAISNNLCVLSVTNTLTGSQAANTLQTSIMYEVELYGKYNIPFQSL